MDSENNDIVEINIKNLKNKYDIFLNKQIKTDEIKTYEGKNIQTKEKILIDVYTHDILCFAKRVINNIIQLKHNNIVNILDIIIDNSNIYIIKNYYEIKLLDVEFNISYIIDLIDVIKYLLDNNIDILELKIEDIYLNSELVLKISPKFIETKPNKKILYGSPLFSPPNIIQDLKIQKEEKFIKNISLIFIQFYLKKNYNNTELNQIFYDIDENDKYYNLLYDMINNNIRLNKLYNKLNNKLNGDKKILNKHISRLLSNDIFIMDL